MFNLFRMSWMTVITIKDFSVCCEWIHPTMETGMRTGLPNTHMARGFSVLYHVFARKQCVLCSALRYKSYLTLPYVTSLRDSFCLGTFAHGFIRLPSCSITSSRGNRDKTWLRVLVRVTTGSYYRGLRGKSLVFWIGGRLWEVVAYERWSHMEVRLYLLSENIKFLLTSDSFSVKAWTSSLCFFFTESSFSCHSCSVSKRADSTLMALSAKKLAVSSFNSSWWEDSSCDFTAPMTSRWRSLKSEKEQKNTTIIQSTECTVKRSNFEKKLWICPLEQGLSFSPRFTIPHMEGQIWLSLQSIDIFSLYVLFSQ